jgi:hypothetical protein
MTEDNDTDDERNYDTVTKDEEEDGNSMTKATRVLNLPKELFCATYKKKRASSPVGFCWTANQAMMFSEMARS